MKSTKNFYKETIGFYTGKEGISAVQISRIINSVVEMLFLRFMFLIFFYVFFKSREKNRKAFEPSAPLDYEEFFLTLIGFRTKFSFRRLSYA